MCPASLETLEDLAMLWLYYCVLVMAIVSWNPAVTAVFSWDHQMWLDSFIYLPS